MGRKIPAEVRLAANRQLWRANWLGRLRLADDEGEALTSEELKAVIADDLAARGIGAYPKPGETLPPRRWAPGRPLPPPLLDEKDA